MRRIIQLAGYTLSAIGIFLLVLWALRGASPAIDCGIVDAIFALDWQTAYACLDQSDYDPIVAVVTMLGGALLALAARLAPVPAQSGAYNPTVEERQRNRAELIRRVRRIWITGYLQQSLYQEVLLFLGIKWDAVTPPPNPFGMTIQRIDGKPQAYQPPDLALAIGSPLAAFYEDVDHRLLILGAPGAGKTTVMLDLAKTLLDKAEADAAIPVPVVFTLSSWPGPETPFDDWLVSEMRTRYGGDIQERVARHWLEHDEIALFLDGLDELPADRRAAAVAAIEAYRALGRWFVVCSRAAEYADLNRHDVAFTNLDALHIQPLQQYQIQGYLSELRGEQPRRLAEVIAADQTLEEVADPPLMLNVMLLASEMIDWSQLTGSDQDVLRGSVFDAYVQAMLTRPRSSPHYSAAKTLHWLQWLAKKMVEHDQIVFLLERMKRSWFNQKWQRYIGVPIFVAGLGLSFGLFFGLSFGLVSGLSFALVSGLSFGLFFGLSDLAIEEQTRLEINRDVLNSALSYGLTGGLIVGLIVGLSYKLSFGLIVGVVFGLTGGLKTSSNLDQSYCHVDVSHGVRQSFKNGVVFGVIFGVIFGISGELTAGLSEEMRIALGSKLSFGPSFGLSLGLIGGLSYGLFFGIESTIKHYILRISLWLDGSMPFYYVRFLDACADRILLRKVGGGYMFIHRTFMEYIAALTPARIDALAARIDAITAQAPQPARKSRQRRTGRQ